MNINRIGSANAAGIYKKNQSSEKPVQSSTAKRDDLVISQSGQIFNTALKAAKESPEIREAKVAEITRKIKSGGYGVSSSEIAERMIKGAGFDKSV